MATTDQPDTWALLDYAQSTNVLLYSGSGLHELAPLASAHVQTAATALGNARRQLAALAALDGLGADVDPYERADVERQIRRHLAVADRRARDAAEEIQKHMGSGASLTGALAMVRWLVELYDNKANG